VQRLQKTGSVTLTRDPTRPDPTKIVDPVTRDPKTWFQTVGAYNYGDPPEKNLTPTVLRVLELTREQYDACTCSFAQEQV